MYIPDLTERFPEGFGGVDMCEPYDPEYEFWKNVEEAEKAEREYYNRPKREMWVSFYLQDGTQNGATLTVRDADEAEEKLMEEYGEMWGGIADYGFYDELD